MSQAMTPRAAVRSDATLGAPGVGTWRPHVAEGVPLVPGARLGSLVCDGQVVPVIAPPDVGGVATDVLPAGTWVAYGAPLMVQGEGGPTVAAAKVATQPGGGPEGCVAVRAETDGTVYLRPEPGAPAFAAVGSAVAANATLALVEVMKTFTPVRSPMAGTVERVDVGEAAGVGEGTPLFWIRPGA
ncbi:MAG: hypothetical protein H6733_05290 [Alphaproteobacteria bacterium]|nr:hypothetical protein [Alphaproteobacteria bacterium]